MQASRKPAVVGWESDDVDFKTMEDWQRWERRGARSRGCASGDERPDPGPGILIGPIILPTLSRTRKPEYRGYSATFREQIRLIQGDQNNSILRREGICRTRLGTHLFT